jgi:hypothetical protein
MDCEHKIDKKRADSKIPIWGTLYFDFDACPESETSGTDVTKIRQVGGENP